jgi:hypothetical protein
MNDKRQKNQLPEGLQLYQGSRAEERDCPEGSAALQAEDTGN